MWELLERVGIIVMIVGFIALGTLSWTGRQQTDEVLRRLSLFEDQLKQQATPLRQGFEGQASDCDMTCVRELVAEAIATVSGISTPTKQEVVERVVEKVQTVSNSGPSSYYVPIGAGETTNREWTDIAGAEVTFDVSDFGTISQIYFEAQLSSPTAGLVYARLWDTRDGHIIIGSENSHTSGDAKLVSSPVTVPTGGRTIRAQLRSENGQTVKLLSSRLRVDVR